MRFPTYRGRPSTKWASLQCELLYRPSFLRKRPRATHASSRTASNRRTAPVRSASSSTVNGPADSRVKILSLLAAERVFIAQGANTRSRTTFPNMSSTPHLADRAPAVTRRASCGRRCGLSRSVETQQRSIRASLRPSQLHDPRIIPRRDFPALPVFQLLRQIHG